MVKKNKKVLVPMVADILHHGHINIIEQASRLGTITVGLSSDKFVKKVKGHFPTLPYFIRRKIVLGIKGVDSVIQMDSFDVPLGFDYVVHGDDWRPPYKLNGAKYIEIPATKGISSSLIKQWILKSK